MNCGRKRFPAAYFGYELMCISGLVTLNMGLLMQTKTFKLFIAKYLLLFLLFISGLSCSESGNGEKTKLVVLIGIDQFRSSYLEEYGAAFSGGFQRLLAQGHYYPRAVVDHAPTLSMPGHTTLATGAHPGRHGINANDWFETLPNGKRRRVIIFRDTNFNIVGHPQLTGISPQHLRVTGLADWIRATEPDARTVALSTGNALAMFYGGRALPDTSRNHAYWLSHRAGEFITSSYFRPDYPAWVADFNNTHLPLLRRNRAWKSKVPAAHRSLARADDVPYENNGIAVTFPHVFEYADSSNSEILAGKNAAYNRWFANSPFADEALFALAKKAVEARELGQRQSTDFLALAIKSVDRIGHDFGPASQEQLDILFRLDRLLGDFFQYLDDTIGKDNYLITLSADHGALNIVEYEQEAGRPGRRISEADIQNLLNEVDQFVKTYDGAPEELAEKVAAELEKSDFVARAMTPKMLSSKDPADDILHYYRNSYIPGRNTTFPLWTRKVLYRKFSETHPVNWGIIVEFAEYTSLWTARANHGSSHRYDREVPIIFMGDGVDPGIATTPARTVDVAPTLAELAGIAFPDSVDGIVLPVHREHSSEN